MQQFPLVNNYSTRLAADLNASHFNVFVEDQPVGVRERISQGHRVRLTLFKTDNNGKEVQREIVSVWSASETFDPDFDAGYRLAVDRAQEGTEAMDFAEGDGVEARLTAGSLSLLGENNGIAIGNVSGGPGGNYGFVAIGHDVGRPAARAVSVGSSTRASGDDDLAVGAEANTTDREGLPPGYITMPPNCTALGRQSFAGTRAAVAVGTNATAEGVLSTAVGNLAVAKERFSQVLGGHSFAFAEGGTVLGSCSVALAENSVAMGSGAVSTLMFGRKSTAIPYLSHEGYPTPDPLIKGYVMANDLTYREVIEAAIVRATPFPGSIQVPQELSAALDTVGQISEQVVLGSNLIDLTDVNSTAAITLPDRAMLFVDAIDVVIMEASGAGGSPVIQLSPYPGTPNTYLSNATITKLSVGGRETFTPDNEDGTQMLFISVASAGTGTLKAKVVVRGYVMEMQALDQLGLGEEKDLVRFRPTPTNQRWGWTSGSGDNMV
ncbi:hypothetical protein [Halomonas alkaliantarctica]|uniref:hypothetical protein n=1 Tax=Halomonas alkaliantarctica TaxID=232346 RepID=UPI002657C451|nr:hypothetical protein [Halomonas alkaliantarctica]